MRLDRRAFTGGLGATLVAPRARAAGTVQDATGRSIAIPDKVARVFPAGPPAAIMLYTLAPELLLGWPRANRADECAFLLPDICTRPEVGRLTGRGNTANLESVIALKPDLILDVGSTSPTFTSLAARVQEQTGIPYALLDGRFEVMPTTYRQLGALTQRDAAPLADYAEQTLAKISARVNRDPGGRASARLLCARSARPGNRARRLDQCRDHRVSRRAQRRRRAQGRARQRLDRAGAAWNPDVIVTIDRDFAANVRSDPQWKDVAAVRAGRVHLSPKLPFGWVDFPPSVNRLIGLWWLAKILYPEHFKEDMRELTRDFYKLSIT